ncbi:MAG: 30S ribosomal protein S6 [Candidatus Spechtbacterales bacterium]|nr:30S ribosomal protein S6 [Candidatus Spechtbacterales bacterium]
MNTVKTPAKEAEKTKTTEENYYEFYLVVSPEAINDNSSEIEKVFESILVKHGAEVKRRERFAKNELAYPIKKTLFAYIGSFYFVVNPNKVTAIKEDIRNSDIDILRWIVVSTEEKTTTQDTIKMHSLEEELEEVEKKVEKVAKEEKTDQGNDQDNKTSKSKAKKKTEEESDEDDDESSTIENIDKKLDEIMSNL